MKPNLSILICTMEQRASLYKRLEDKLVRQLPSTAEVEYFVLKDRGELSIGEKREKLKHKATGEYIVYIDDDDLISRNYIRNILATINNPYKIKPDAIGIKGIYTTDGKNRRRLFCSNIYRSWKDEGNKVIRPVNHLNPVKREIALQAPFPSIYYGEDRFYSEALKDLITTEIMAPGWLYWYDYRPNNSQSVAMDIKDNSKGLKMLQAAGL